MMGEGAVSGSVDYRRSSTHGDTDEAEDMQHEEVERRVGQGENEAGAEERGAGTAGGDNGKVCGWETGRCRISEIRDHESFSRYRIPYLTLPTLGRYVHREVRFFLPGKVPAPAACTCTGTDSLPSLRYGESSWTLGPWPLASGTGIGVSELLGRRCFQGR